MEKRWFDEAWEDYLYWQMQDKKTLKRINILLRDIERNLFEGSANLSRFVVNWVVCGAAESMKRIA